MARQYAKRFARCTFYIGGPDTLVDLNAVLFFSFQVRMVDRRFSVVRLFK